MSIQRRLVFVDASVLVAACRSPRGGSAMALEACQRPDFQAAVTAEVILEARTNILRKFGDAELIAFYEQLSLTLPLLIPPPSQRLLEQCAFLTSAKDAHVLAAAFECRAEFLLTLDKRHLLNPVLLAQGLTARIMTPGDFLREASGS